MYTDEKKHFCSCDKTSCKFHPANHDKGCDLCIEKNLKRGEIPTCFFQAVNKDISSVKNFTMQGFVEFYLNNK